MRVAVVGDVLNDAEVCVRGGGKRGCRIDFPIFLSSLVCYSTRTKKKEMHNDNNSEYDQTTTATTRTKNMCSVRCEIQRVRRRGGAKPPGESGDGGGSYVEGACRAAVTLGKNSKAAMGVAPSPFLVLDV
jgi:hypothetical protein